MTQTLQRSIGTLGGASIMIGVMIGSGIFRTPASIAQELGSPAIILLFWLGGGVLCLFGALTYAELATMHPQSGGVYVFLYKGLGPCVAFVFGWSYVLITQPLALSAISVVFAEHFNRLLGSEIDTRILTCAVIVGLTAWNATGIERGTHLAVILTSAKVLALAAIVAAALVLMKGDASHFVGGAAPKPLLAALAPVFAAILWTYDGWSDAAAVAEEVSEPQKRLPRIFLLGTAGITALYVAVNAAYIGLVPLTEMRGTDTVAPLVMERLVGPAAATVVTIMILVSTLGATHSSIIIGSRVTFAQARDGLLFRFLAHVHAKYRTPTITLWAQAALACLATWTLGRFEDLISGFVFAIWIFYGLAAAAVIVLRIRQPMALRPYRCWGYPVVPVLFIMAAATMTVLAIHDSPRTMLPALAILLAGVPAYYLWRALAGPPANPPTEEQPHAPR